MKKTDEYYQALEVCNNAKNHHNMDVIVARTYVRAYDEAINYSQCCMGEAEQLFCSCGSRKVKTTGGSQCTNNRCSL